MKLISVLFYCKMKVKLNKKGYKQNGIDTIQRQKIRFTLMSYGSMMREKIEEVMVKKVLYQFFFEKLKRERMIGCVKRMIDLVNMVARRIRDRIQTKDSKIIVLEMLWEKTLSEFKQKAQKKLNKMSKGKDKTKE